MQLSKFPVKKRLRGLFYEVNLPKKAFLETLDLRNESVPPNGR